jgi:hypothetical protein
VPAINGLAGNLLVGLGCTVKPLANNQLAEARSRGVQMSHVSVLLFLLFLLNLPIVFLITGLNAVGLQWAIILSPRITDTKQKKYSYADVNRRIFGQ